MATSNGFCKNIYENNVNKLSIRCVRCKKFYEVKDFTSGQLGRMYPYCRLCIKEARKKSRRTTEWKRNDIKITMDEYNKLLSNQKNKCAICKNEETFIHYYTKEKIKLAVDHCHVSNSIRGLLCRHCNLMIGNSKESEKTLRSGARYLSMHTRFSTEPTNPTNPDVK